EVELSALGEVRGQGDAEQSALVVRRVHPVRDVQQRGGGEPGGRVVDAYGSGVLGDEQPSRAVVGRGQGRRALQAEGDLGGGGGDLVQRHRRGGGRGPRLGGVRGLGRRGGKGQGAGHDQGESEQQTDPSAA